MEKLRKNFICSSMFSFLGSCSLLCISFMQNNNNRIVPFIIASLFWGSILTEAVFIWKTGAERKKIEQKSKIKPRKWKNGFISFCKTPIGKIADVFSVIFLFVLLILICLNVSDSKYVIPVLSGFYFSLHSHSLFNGKNYRFMRAYFKHKKGEI